jgi:hypothetical protein
MSFLKRYPTPWRVFEQHTGKAYGVCGIEDANGEPVLLMSKDTDGDAARAIALATNGAAVMGTARIRELESLLKELSCELAEMRDRFT